VYDATGAVIGYAGAVRGGRGGGRGRARADGGRGRRQPPPYQPQQQQAAQQAAQQTAKPGADAGDGYTRAAAAVPEQSSLNVGAQVCGTAVRSLALPVQTKPFRLLVMYQPVRRACALMHCCNTATLHASNTR